MGLLSDSESDDEESMAGHANEFVLETPKPPDYPLNVPPDTLSHETKPPSKTTVPIQKKTL